MTDAPLFAGLKVIDCASFIAGPAAATILADHGADVIKIEPPGAGDPYRQLHTRPGTPNPGIDYAWLMDSRTKRGLALDLKSPGGRAVLERLVSQADVFVTNFPLPVRERLKLRYADFATKYPRLIYASLTAYGEAGPEADKTGFDTTAYWARSGLMDQVRADSAAMPARSVPGMGDHPTASALFGGIASALYRRERTGQGAEVRASLLNAGMWANSFLIQAVLCGGTIPPRLPRAQTLNALGNMYHTSDARWFIVAVVSEDRQWPQFAAAIGRPDLIADPRFATTQARRANATALMDICDTIFAANTLAHWRETLDRAGITFGPIGTTEEIAADEQALAVGALRPFENDSMLTVDSPFTIEGSPKTPPRRAPDIGQHSREILRDAGYTSSEITALMQSGAVAGK
ncbi:MAG: CoA transferase [Acetobacteraceae bacterium]|nr:CoA transferase [Acetobacteraceae bacterium]